MTDSQLGLGAAGDALGPSKRFLDPFSHPLGRGVALMPGRAHTTSFGTSKPGTPRCFIALDVTVQCWLSFRVRRASVLEPELALALFVAPFLLDAAYDASPRDLRDN